MGNLLEKRFEQYTMKRPQEVLIVDAEIAGEEDRIVIFRRFSSSLMGPTASDPDVLVLPDDAKILSIDRVASPYDPASPIYLEQGMTWERMQALLSEAGV